MNVWVNKIPTVPICSYCQAETQVRELAWQKEDSVHVEPNLDHN